VEYDAAERQTVKFRLHDGVSFGSCSGNIMNVIRDKALMDDDLVIGDLWGQTESGVWSRCVGPRRRPPTVHSTACSAGCLLNCYLSADDCALSLGGLSGPSSGRTVLCLCLFSSVCY